MSSGVLQFRSWGFELFVPPTPFAQPPKPARFVMLDDPNGVFYDIDYETSLLGNAVTWGKLALHTVRKPAIVFPPEQQDMLQKQSFATALLVSIESQDASITVARSLGQVNIKPLPREFMNWAALRGMKGPELPAEMRAGLLRRVWNRNSENTELSAIPLVTPTDILDDMPSDWHRNGKELNDVLDKQFVGAKMFGPPSRWRVSGLTKQQIEKSRARAAILIDK